MNVRDFEVRAEALIKQADAVLATKTSGGYGWSVAPGIFAGFRAAALSFLQNLYGVAHPYFTDFNARCKESKPSDTSEGQEILRAALEELRGGWFVTARALISAEIFADFLEMADHLLEQKYKDPAAVMVGSILEEHLRQLCAKHGLNTHYQKGADMLPKKADVLNADLAGATIYNKLDQKNITGWLDLRNKAAHGKYAEYTIEQVQIMRLGVGEFMARVTT